jgi:hypothetical protein
MIALPLSVFASCHRCGWFVALEVTAATAPAVAQEIALLVAEHARTVHPGTKLVTMVIDERPQAES